MLSVFITPCTKPTSIHRATSSACASTTRRYSSRYGFAAAAASGWWRAMAWSASARRRSRSPDAAAYWNVPTRRWLAATRQSTAPGSGPLPQHPLARGHDGERPRRRDPEAVHRLADQVLPQHRAHRRLAVAAAGERRAARPLEVHVAAAARHVDHLAEQQRPAVAEARHVPAELVAGVGLRHRRDPVRQPVPDQQRHARRLPQRGGVDAQLGGQLLVEHQQLRRRNRRGRPRHRQARHRAGVGVVELEQRPARRSLLEATDLAHLDSPRMLPSSSSR